jgi:hypothetical protein
MSPLLSRNDWCSERSHLVYVHCFSSHCPWARCASAANAVCSSTDTSRYLLFNFNYLNWCSSLLFFFCFLLLCSCVYSLKERRPCHSSSGYSGLHIGATPSSIPGRVTWDLWWTKRHWGRFPPRTSVSPANSHSTNCSVFINHPVTDAM